MDKAGATVDNRDRSAPAQPLFDVGWMAEATPAEVKALLDRGADPRASNKNGWTPLHLAAQFNENPGVVTLLLDRGADPRASNNGHTPLHWAVRSNGNPGVVTLLLDRGADPRVPDKNGRTPLHEAAQFNENPGVVTLLLDRGANPQARTKDGWTPLHWAVRFNKNPAVVTLLLDQGADPQAQDKDGTTLLHLAVMSNDPSVVTLLLDRGADPQARAKDGTTPLHLAAQFNDPAVGALLLDRGADPRARDKNGETPRLDALSHRYVQYQKDLWKDRREKLGARLLMNFLPTGFSLMRRLALLFEPVFDLEPDIQMVKKGWTWPAFFFVLAWAFLIRIAGNVLRENPSLEGLLSAIGLPGTSLLDGLIFVGIVVAIVPGILLLVILVIWVLPDALLPLLVAPVVWRQITRCHWARAALLSLLLVAPVVWLPLGTSDGLLMGLAFILACIFGRWGNGWREQNLLRRGYEYRETVIARQSPVKIYVRDL